MYIFFEVQINFVLNKNICSAGNNKTIGRKFKSKHFRFAFGSDK